MSFGADLGVFYLRKTKDGVFKGGYGRCCRITDSRMGKRTWDEPAVFSNDSIPNSLLHWIIIPQDTPDCSEESRSRPRGILPRHEKRRISQRETRPDVERSQSTRGQQPYSKLRVLRKPKNQRYKHSTTDGPQQHTRNLLKHRYFTPNSMSSFVGSVMCRIQTSA